MFEKIFKKIGGIDYSPYTINLRITEVQVTAKTSKITQEKDKGLGEK